MDFICIPSIMIIVYIIIEIFKLFLKKHKKNLPVVAGVFGGIISVFAYFFIPGVFDEVDLLTVIAIGIISGLSATGSNQVIKQLLKKGDE